MALYHYLEWFQTECAGTVGIKALKVDGAGKSLKHFFGCGSFKSCDYITIRSDEVFCIEISDFTKQLSQLQMIHGEVCGKIKKGGSKLIKSDRKVVQWPDDLVKKEIDAKICGTLHLYTAMQEDLQLKDRKLSFFLVICSAQKADFIAFETLVRHFPQKYARFLNNVKVLTLKDFEKKFQNPKFPHV